MNWKIRKEAYVYLWYQKYERQDQIIETEWPFGTKLRTARGSKAFSFGHQKHRRIKEI